MARNMADCKLSSAAASSKRRSMELLFYIYGTDCLGGYPLVNDMVSNANNTHNLPRTMQTKISTV